MKYRMSERAREMEPRRSVFCCCGAQWHGRYAVDNSYINRHAIDHGLISRDEFLALNHALRQPPEWKREARLVEQGRKVDAVDPVDGRVTD